MRQRDIFHAQPLGKLPRRAGELQRRLSARFAHHFDIAPTHSQPPPGPEGLHRALPSRQSVRRNARIYGDSFRSRPLRRACTAVPVSARRGASAPPRSGQSPRCPAPIPRSSAPSPRYEMLPEMRHSRRRGIIPIIDMRRGWRHARKITTMPMPPATKRKPRTRRTSRATTSQRAAEWRPRRANGLQILESPEFARLDWLTHGFSTRPGGASEFPTPQKSRAASGKVLNLGFTDWDSRARVLENRKKFFASLGAAKCAS